MKMMAVGIMGIVAVVVASVVSAVLLYSPEAFQELQGTAPKTTDGTTPTSAQINKILDARTGAKWGTVTEIIDGDTILIDSATHRLNLIDTPERGEEGFLEAANALKELCPQGSAVLYDENSMEPFDMYERRLGVIWCKGNDYSATAGQWLSENGLLEKFYTEHCSTTEAASISWATAQDNVFYYDVCS